MSFHTLGAGLHTSFLQKGINGEDFLLFLQEKRFKIITASARTIKPASYRRTTILPGSPVFVKEIKNNLFLCSTERFSKTIPVEPSCLKNCVLLGWEKCSTYLVQPKYNSQEQK